jgi:hypothetical protein
MLVWHLHGPATAAVSSLFLAAVVLKTKTTKGIPLLFVLYMVIKIGAAIFAHNGFNDPYAWAVGIALLIIAIVSAR